MNVYHKPEGIPCLWSLTTLESLKLQGIIEKESFMPERLPYFDGKTIIDVGAGISDMLKIISQKSTPKRLIAIDPIYATQEEFSQSVQLTLELVQKYTGMIRKELMWVLYWRKRDNATLRMSMRSYFKLKDRKRLISEACIDTNGELERFANIDDIGQEQADILHMSFLFYFHPSPLEFLQSLAKFVQADGHIFVTDFMHRGNVRRLIKYNESIIEITGIDMIGGYCCIKIKKENIQKIVLQ